MKTDLPQLTIFTPTYNRRDLLKRLYISLVNQLSKSFIWVIVDDGSTDGTLDMVNQWGKESDFEIKYVYQQNQGKSAAFNKGIDMTETELFFCVDSDDYLSYKAVSRVLECWEYCKDDDIGILARREVTRVPDDMVTGVRTTMLDAYRVHHIKGDTMIVHKTEFLKNYRFPRFESEKFVPEAYLYDKLDLHGTLFFLNEILYFGNYIEGGYTKNMASVIKASPLGYEAFILQRLSMEKDFRYLFLDSIRYVAIEKVLRRKISQILRKAPNVIAAIIAYPFGSIFNYYRYKGN